MAMADYRLCDKCGEKAFYDSNLSYEFAWEKGSSIPADELVRGEQYKLGYLGDWAVLCTDCAKTHKCIIVQLDKSRPFAGKPEAE